MGNVYCRVALQQLMHLCAELKQKATHSSCQVADTLHLLYNGTIIVHLYIL